MPQLEGAGGRLWECKQHHACISSRRILSLLVHAPRHGGGSSARSVALSHRGPACIPSAIPAIRTLQARSSHDKQAASTSVSGVRQHQCQRQCLRIGRKHRRWEETAGSARCHCARQDVPRWWIRRSQLQVSSLSLTGIPKQNKT